MRDIFFRGETYSNRIVYGYLNNLIEDYTGELSFFIENHHEIIMIKKESISQYTGLKDSTGEMIFENDTILSAHHGKGIVLFDDGAFWFYGDTEVKEPVKKLLCDILNNVCDSVKILK